MLGGIPHEKVFLADQKPVQRADDGIKRIVCLKGNEDQVKAKLREQGAGSGKQLSVQQDIPPSLKA